MEPLLHHQAWLNPSHCLHPADEHYFPTLLGLLGRQRETECSTWGVAAQDWSQGGPHPKSFT